MGLATFGTDSCREPNQSRIQGTISFLVLNPKSYYFLPPPNHFCECIKFTGKTFAHSLTKQWLNIKERTELTQAFIHASFSYTWGFFYFLKAEQFHFCFSFLVSKYYYLIYIIYFICLLSVSLFSVFYMYS